MYIFNKYPSELKCTL